MIITTFRVQTQAIHCSRIKESIGSRATVSAVAEYEQVVEVDQRRDGTARRD